MNYKAIEIFQNLPIKPTPAIFTIVFNACAKTADDEASKIGRTVLESLAGNLLENEILINSAIDMLMKFGDVTHAETLFNKMKRKTIVTFVAMMKGYISNGSPKKAIELFQKLTVTADASVFTTLFNACAKVADADAIKIGRNFLQQIRPDHKKNEMLMNSSIDMLMKFGDVKYAEELFSQMNNKSTVTYGAMMQGYIVNGMPTRAIELFRNLPSQPNATVITIVLNACAKVANQEAMTLGRDLLERFSSGFADNEILMSAAIDMLMKFGDIKEAERLFSQQKNPSTSIYGIMMNGYNFNSRFTKCLTLFEQVQRRGLTIDESIAMAVVSACAKTGLISTCRRMIESIPKHLQEKTQLKNLLIDMWVCYATLIDAKGVETEEKKTISH